MSYIESRNCGKFSFINAPCQISENSTSNATGFCETPSNVCVDTWNSAVYAKELDLSNGQAATDYSGMTYGQHNQLHSFRGRMSLNPTSSLTTADNAMKGRNVDSVSTFSNQPWDDVTSDCHRRKTVSLEQLMSRRNSMESTICQIPSLTTKLHHWMDKEQTYATTLHEQLSKIGESIDHSVLSSPLPDVVTASTDATLQLPEICSRLKVHEANQKKHCVDAEHYNITPKDVVNKIDGEYMERRNYIQTFDPANPFSYEDLKTQPIMRKAKKVYVPEECKDSKYWTRRLKNNVAARRSREARRIKENQIVVRAGFLQNENNNLRSEVENLRNELKRLEERMKLNND